MREHALWIQKDGGWVCVCGKTRNTLRSLQRHIKQERKGAK